MDDAGHGIAFRVVETVEIRATPEAVWDVISDLSTHPDWRPAVVELVQLTPGPLAVGAELREVLRWRGRTFELTDEVTRIEPPRRLTIAGGWKAASFELDLSLEPSPEGTTVTFDWPLVPRTRTMRLLAPLLKGAMQRATREEAELLKQLVESRSGE